MKSINKSGLKSKEIKDIINNINEILKDLRNPFEVKFFTYYQTKKKIKIIMEYVEGGNFINLLSDKGKVSEDYMRIYSAEIVLVIEHLHRNNIVHRDLSSKNIMVDENGHIKVGGFEFAKKMEKPAVYPICGSLEYNAPEVLEKGFYSRASDWWSLVLFQLIIGNHYL